MAPIIIIGTGLAGYQLAKEFRKLDLLSGLILITADEGRFYSKPLLSTAFTQQKNFDTLTMATAEQMAQQLNAEIFTNCFVTKIDPQNKVLTLNDKTSLPYSKLVLACGAEVLRPKIAGDGAADILSINHIYHYRDFQKLIERKKQITILGAGLIGCEFANDLSNAGYQVTVVALGNSPLDLLVPEEIGRILQTALEKNGVQFYFGRSITSINRDQQKYKINLTDQTAFDTEFVLSAIGLRPNVTLAKMTGIAIDRGVLVNRFLETNLADIYALGDCAEVEGHVLPYIAPLLNASKALSKTLTGSRTAVDYPAMPVLVKTPALPFVVCPPKKNLSGEWVIQGQDSNNIRALFHDNQKQLQGFVLTGECVKEKMQLVKTMPGLF